MKSRFLARLARRLGSRRNKEGGPSKAAYDRVFASFLKRLPSLAAEVERNKQLAEKRYSELAEGPEARRALVIASSRPATLVAFTYRLIQHSFAERFRDVGRSLHLARLACRTAEAIGGSEYLSQHSTADLNAEALLHLANALRLNSDTLGCEQTLDRAEKMLQIGTGDRFLRADLHSFRASLRVRQRRIAEAGAELDREIAVRRLLDDERRVGVALTDRGIIACHAGDLDAACEFLRQGTQLAQDDNLAQVALINLAEALARKGKGPDAWTVLCRTETIHALAGNNDLTPQIRWTKGLAYLALDEFGAAESELREVRGILVEAGRSHFTGSVSVDLACALAAQGKYREIQQLASEAHQLFAAEGLDQHVLESLTLLRKAADAECLTADFAAKVATFVARSRYDRNLRFEHQLP